MSEYKFVTQEEIQYASDFIQMGKIIGRLLAERDAYRDAYREVAKMCDEEMPGGVEAWVDAEAARLMGKK